MKKVIWMFLILMLMIVYPGLGVYASELSTETTENSGSSGSGHNIGEHDEKGHVTSGYIEVVHDAYTHYLAPVKNETGLYIVKYSETDYKIFTVGTNKSISIEGQVKIGEDGAWKPFNQRDVNSPYPLWPPNEGTQVATSIPIFDFTDSNFESNVDNYIKNGDVSNAINSSDVQNTDYDASVEAPKNLTTKGKLNTTWLQEFLHFLSENRKIDISWDYPSDWKNYSHDIEMRFSWIGGHGKKGVTEWYSYKKAKYPNYYTTSEGKARMLYELTGKELDAVFEPGLNTYFNGPLTPEGMDIDYVEFRVRNVTQFKHSNWVSVRLNKDGTSNAVETDENGNLIEDSDYDGGDVNEDHQDTSVDMDLDGFSDILEFIKSGFGLLGTNGLISMFKSFFSFVPEKFWSLILIGVGLMIVAAVVNFLMKR